MVVAVPAVTCSHERGLGCVRCQTPVVSYVDGGCSSAYASSMSDEAVDFGVLLDRARAVERTDRDERIDEDFTRIMRLSQALTPRGPISRQSA